MINKIKSTGKFGTIIGICAMASFALFSCSKSSSSTSSKYVGTWSMHQMTTDTNNNGLLDGTDLVENTDSIGFFLKFNANGTGSSIAFGDTSSFTWNLTNGDTYFKIIDSSSTSYYQITSSTNSSFTVKDTAQHPMVWQTFNKQ